jgi:hypothetical protein
LAILLGIYLPQPIGTVVALILIVIAVVAGWWAYSNYVAGLPWIAQIIGLGG